MAVSYFIELASHCQLVEHYRLSYSKTCKNYNLFIHMDPSDFFIHINIFVFPSLARDSVWASFCAKTMLSLYFFSVDLLVWTFPTISYLEKHHHAYFNIPMLGHNVTNVQPCRRVKYLYIRVISSLTLIFCGLSFIFHHKFISRTIIPSLILPCLYIFFTISCPQNSIVKHPSTITPTKPSAAIENGKTLKEILSM